MFKNPTYMEHATLDDAYWYLMEHCKYLDRGASALIFEHPTLPRIFRLSHYKEPTAHYLKTCARIKHCVEIPRVYSYIFVKDEYALVEVERLDEVDWDNMPHDLESLINQFNELKDMLDFEKHMAVSYSWVDLHSENIMSRAGQVVFTDPFYNGNTPESMKVFLKSHASKNGTLVPYSFYYTRG